jgi:tRNA-specific 2-thiouridylase
LLNAKKRDSQDICFMPRGGTAAFLEKHARNKPLPGNFTDADGRVLGRHKGIAGYTVGQRKGLGLSMPAPMYVTAVCAKSNTVTLGGAESLYSTALLAEKVNFIAAAGLEGDVRVTAKIRSGQPEQAATVRQISNDCIRVDFLRPQRAVTPGQAVVLYDGDCVVCAGTIVKALA